VPYWRTFGLHPSIYVHSLGLSEGPTSERNFLAATALNL
jgi:hypothetical protein